MREREIPACELVISTRVIKHETRRGGYLLSMICSCRYCGGSKLEREPRRQSLKRCAVSRERRCPLEALCACEGRGDIKTDGGIATDELCIPPLTTFSLIVVSW